MLDTCIIDICSPRMVGPPWTFLKEWRIEIHSKLFFSSDVPPRFGTNKRVKFSYSGSLNGTTGSSSVRFVSVPPEQPVKGLLLSNGELTGLDSGVVNAEQGIDIVH